ncbi:amidohydrolase [Dyadobacter luteus]|uniref:Omega-amidase YafV n=1 Tax=Dyadobacter luteus TaxID=2259619 RepID=A0A3D8Y923_9BACT|nr:amidohydrolase [Dyadobacter luteus]REA59263.1 amidohydrolase [Dyadobacter luteus]
MKESLAIAIIQADLYWEDVTANLASLEETIATFDKPVDVIVLPEMFNTGFTMNVAFAEPMNLTTTRWMKQIARQTDALVIGSFAVREGENYFNRLLYAYPDGGHDVYDKRHLFRMGEEHKTYSGGSVNNQIAWKGWNIRALICYDLRFPVWSRNAAANPYDLLIYVANWPARRVSAWNTLLKARAIENQSYVVGVNRLGVDGHGTDHNGNSVVNDFLGESIAMMGESAGYKIISISKQHLDNYRKSFPAYLDADSFELLTQ